MSEKLRAIKIVRYVTFQSRIEPEEIKAEYKDCILTGWDYNPIKNETYAVLQEILGV